jgi:hypothetical protein
LKETSYPGAVALQCENCRSEVIISAEYFNRSALKSLLVRDGILSDSENSDGLIIKFKGGCPLCGLEPEGEIEVSKVKTR